MLRARRKSGRKLRKTKPKSSMDSVNAIYNNFCSKTVHDPFFNCCVVTSSSQCTEDEVSEIFSQMSLTSEERALLGAGGKRSPSKKSRSSANLSRGSSSRSMKKKYFSTSDLRNGCQNPTLKRQKVKRKLVDLHVKNVRMTDSGFGSLSEQFQTLRASIPDLSSKNLDEIPDHDKKILARMALRRTKELEMIEDAQIARQFWDAEKRAREKFIAEQNEQYAKTIAEKRKFESIETQKRLERRQMEQQAQIERLKMELAEKEAKTEALLKTLEFHKEVKLYQKRQREFHKIDAAMLNSQEVDMSEVVYRNILIERLQQRVQKAEAIRQRVLDVYKSRIQTDNQLEQAIHAANFDETKKLEKFRMQQLRDKIQQRDEKFRQFARHRERKIEESQRRAKISAAMRDLVKRSISPDGILQKAWRPERPVSNLSHCDSHIVLG